MKCFLFVAFNGLYSTLTWIVLIFIALPIERKAPTLLCYQGERSIVVFFVTCYSLFAEFPLQVVRICCEGQSLYMNICQQV